MKRRKKLDEYEEYDLDGNLTGRFSVPSGIIPHQDNQIWFNEMRKIPSDKIIAGYRARHPSGRTPDWWPKKLKKQYQEGWSKE